MIPPLVDPPTPAPMDRVEHLRRLTRRTGHDLLAATRAARRLPELLAALVLIATMLLWLGLRADQDAVQRQVVRGKAEALRVSVVERTVIREFVLRRLAFASGRFGDAAERT